MQPGCACRYLILHLYSADCSYFRSDFLKKFCTFASVMRTMISKILMTFAAFTMLLMSAIPHHHHCTEAGTSSHIDYICFAADDAENYVIADGDCHNEREHHSDDCLLHSIVTLLERIQNVPSYHPALEAVIPQSISVSLPGKYLTDRFIVPFSERIVSFCIVRSSGLRAPPSFS